MTDAHGRSSDRATNFTADDVRQPSHAERARTLVSGQSTGALCSLALEPAGHPYGSFVTFALHEGEPVFLISRIAEHTRNLASDPRASLLVHEQGNHDPLANGRVTLLGRVRRLARASEPAAEGELASVREAFLALHPGSAYYVDYADFDFWKLELEALRYIGGYGRMSWVEAREFRAAAPDPLTGAVGRILTHMNEDHGDALLLYARAFTSAAAPEKVVMTAIDRYGFDLTITTPEGVGPARIAFDEPLMSAEQARTVLVALVRKAEDALARPA